MEASVRDLKNRLSEYLRHVGEGREVVVTSHGKAVARLVGPRPSRPGADAVKLAAAFLRAQPWIRPGKGKATRPKAVARLKPGEKHLAQIVAEQRR